MSDRPNKTLAASKVKRNVLRRRPGRIVSQTSGLCVADSHLENDADGGAGIQQRGRGGGAVRILTQGRT